MSKPRSGYVICSACKGSGRAEDNMFGAKYWCAKCDGIGEVKANE